MWTPSIVGNPRFLVSSRRNDIFSSRKLQVSQTLVPPRRRDVMHVPFSGLPARADDGERNHALAAAAASARG